MTQRIILLTGETEAIAFKEYLLGRNAALDVTSATTLQALSDQVESANGKIRILSFLTGIIVPASILSKLTITPYNIHPAPPEYPGSHAESFAIWERARQYGVTAHEMVAKVDAGSIVAVYRFDMPDAPQRMALADLTFAKAVDVFAVVGAHCAQSDDIMPPVEGERWGPRKTTNKDFMRLCESAHTAAPEDLPRLRAALGEDFPALIHTSGQGTI